MSIENILLTFIGAFIYSFSLNSYFSKLLMPNSSTDGFFASAMLIGLFWLINHGISTPLIFQSGPVWIDMAFASGVGVMVYTYFKQTNEKFPKLWHSMMNWSLLLDAIIGGCLAGIILYLMKW